MRNRLFLLVLVAVILLLQAILRSAAVATPFSSSEMAGGIPFWELRGALPLGVCCAGILLVSTAALLLCAQAALQIGAHRPFLQNNAGQLASACLWCGAPLLAMCLNALPYIFPWLKAYDPTSWQTSQHLDWILNGSIIVLVLCRTVSLLNRPGVSYSILPLSLFCLLALGQMCFAQPLILLPGAAHAAGAGQTLGSHPPAYRYHHGGGTIHAYRRSGSNHTGRSNHLHRRSGSYQHPILPQISLPASSRVKKRLFFPE